MSNTQYEYKYINKKKYSNNKAEHINSFAEEAIKLCNEKGIHSGRDFAMCTFLSKNIYNHLSNQINYVPNENAAYSICFGLKLTFAESCVFLQKGRHSLVPTDSNDKYRELLVEMLITGYTYIPDCNKELTKLGYPPLGSVIR